MRFALKRAHSVFFLVAFRNCVVANVRLKWKTEEVTVRFLSVFGQVETIKLNKEAIKSMLLEKNNAVFNVHVKISTQKRTNGKIFSFSLEDSISVIFFSGNCFEML